jgi:hypothetical protein
LNEQSPVYSQAWNQLPGLGQDIAVGVDGTLWVIGHIAKREGFLVHRWGGTTWERGERAAVRLSAGPASELAIVDAFGVISVQVAGTWRTLPGLASDVAFAPDHSLWAIGNLTHARRTEVARWDGNKWDASPASGTRLAITIDQQPLIVSPAGVVLLREHGAWQSLPGLYADVAIALDGWLYATGIDGITYATSLTATPRQLPNAIAHKVAAFAVGPTGFWMVTRDARILHSPVTNNSSRLTSNQIIADKP